MQGKACSRYPILDYILKYIPVHYCVLLVHDLRLRAPLNRVLTVVHATPPVVVAD